MTESFDLDRFRAAQDNAGTFARALAELRDGRKVTHWMWFVFPQLEGLGQSPTSQRYAIRSLDEAEAYLRDPVLGSRLVECASVLAALDGLSAERILGAIDALKLRSSMTLFARAAPELGAFGEVLGKYFDGAADATTETLLQTGRR
ncbi:MAG TPA: DUF1810 domain-containing protein [Solirubrobacteraceae bacterium]|jgi:uncharacterized protein (DUF1810 family)|nr:DUF1810 domain-containing protein [Solirubrobacteraceae bacterium]